MAVNTLVALPGTASLEDVTDSREPWQRFGYLTIPRVIDSFPDKQRDLARLLLQMAAYRDGADSHFGTELERGQVATTYMDLAARLGWKSPRTAHYHLGLLRETWLAVFGQPIELTSGRAEGQTATSHILIIALGGYAETQQFKNYVNDANVRPGTPAKADNRDSREPNVRPRTPASDSIPIYVRPNVRPTPSQLPIDSTSYSNSSPIYVRPNVRSPSAKPTDSATCEPLTEVERNKEKREDNGNARTAGGPALKTFSLSKLLEEDETEDPEQFYQEAKAVYSCAVEGGYIDGKKRPWQMKDAPEEFSPLMNRPHGLRLELVGLLLTVNDYYVDKAVNTGQLKHFVEGGDIYTAETRRGFRRAELAHLLPEDDKPKQPAVTMQPANLEPYSEKNWRHLEGGGTTGGGFIRAGSVGGALVGALSNAPSVEPGDSVEAHERENFARPVAPYVTPGNGSKQPPLSFIEGGAKARES